MVRVEGHLEGARLRGNQEIRRVWGGEQELVPCALELGSYSKG